MEKESLKEWYVNYTKNRNLIFKNIEKIDDTGKDVIIKYKDGTTEIGIIAESIVSFKDILANLKKEEKISIIVLNKKENIDLLVKEWTDVIEYKSLTVMFVNMNSSTEKRWIIKPFVHDRITEKSVLKSGLLSLASNVEFC